MWRISHHCELIILSRAIHSSSTFCLYLNHLITCDWDKRNTGLRVINKKRLSEGNSNPQPSEPVFKTWGNKSLAFITQLLEHSAWFRRLGVRFPLRSTYFLTHKLWHFHKNIRSCVANECCCPRTVKISHVKFYSKISIPPEPVFKNMGQQMSSPDSSNGILHESEGCGFESPSGGIFCLKIFDTFTRTSVHVSKMNAVACTQYFKC